MFNGTLWMASSNQKTKSLFVSKWHHPPFSISWILKKYQKVTLFMASSSFFQYHFLSKSHGRLPWFSQLSHGFRFVIASILAGWAPWIPIFGRGSCPRAPAAWCSAQLGTGAGAGGAGRPQRRLCSCASNYPLNIQKTMENHHFSWENYGKLTISTGPCSIAIC